MKNFLRIFKYLRQRLINLSLENKLLKKQLQIYEATLESVYYFHETSGILIRVETEWHLISVQDEAVWEHWSIEKNLVSIDGERLVYTYAPPPAYSESNINWPLITLVVGIGGVSVVLLVLWIRKVMW